MRVAAGKSKPLLDAAPSWYGNLLFDLGNLACDLWTALRQATPGPFHAKEFCS